MMPKVSYCGYKTTNIKHGWRLWQQSGTLLFGSCHEIDEFLVD